MELTINSSGYRFSDYSHEFEKSNKNSDLIMKRLRVKHKHTFFKKCFEKEHNYCLPIENTRKVVTEKNYNDFEDNNKLFESCLPTPSKSITSLEEINVNNELSSCSLYAIDVTTELLKDALFENKNSQLNSYEQSSSKSSLLNQPNFNKNSTMLKLDKEDTKLIDNRIDKSCISEESTTLFSPMDIDSDMVKLFPTLDFFTEDNFNEKLEDTTSKEIKNVILSGNVDDKQNNEVLLPNESITESYPKLPESKSIKSILRNENERNDDIQPKLSNNLCKLPTVKSKNIQTQPLICDRYINIFNRYQDISKQKYIEQNEVQGPILLRDLLCGSKPKTIISPYTHRHLKPYIFRDPVTKPLWLQMLNELKEYFRKKKGLSQCSKTETIDYSYVRAKHIKSVNILARQFFWPGIDLSDSLLYPDFSVIALYKNLIIGFGFMVPDISTNENYITFLFTRPYWTGCGIGKFMIYHLIQTCMTRDITLHVSPNNPAMILYQKFGFKIEEFVQNFYVNYISPESGLSRHAFLLRLRSTINMSRRN